jgi:hypothetical protein
MSPPPLSDRGEFSVGLRRNRDDDAGEALQVLVEIEATVEAPLVGGEVTRRELNIARAAGADDGALDVAERRIDLLEFAVARTPATGHSGLVVHAGFAKSVPAPEAIGEHA